MRKIGIGHQNFEELISSNNFYIDKTMFIKEWWDNNDIVTLITRPRRFGKTLNMSMVEQFFSVDYAGRNDLFDKMNIWADEKYRMLQGTYPVIFLSFAGIKASTYETARGSFIQIIIDLYTKYSFLLEGDSLSQQEKTYFDFINMDMPDEVAAMSLHRLALCMNHYYGKKTIILLDEYDTPMEEAYVNGYWQELAAFIQNLFHATFKTNPYMERAIMTGITRISKESIFSDLNNLVVVTTTSKKYQDAFGFTQEEVSASLDEYGMLEGEEDVKKWYDGFTFGEKTDIYNPWSIINYLSNRHFSPYWVNTSSNSLIAKLIREGEPELKTAMEDLLEGGVIYATLDEQVVFSQLGSLQGAVWSLLLASGYLKVVRYNFDEKEGKDEYVLALTNKEVHIMFRQMIAGWFSEFTPSASYYNNFIKALLLDDLKAMNTYMNKVALVTFSYFDTGRGPSAEAEPERFYHGFVLGLIVELSGRYIITSNRESGFGRYDVMLEPLKATDSAIIFEFKVHDPSDEKTLNETVAAALDQIKKKNYAAILESKGIATDRIRQYGFAFEGKKVLIG